MPNYGKPVTDADLLSQLEGSNNATTSKYGTPVTDPEILKQLNGSDSEFNPSFMSKLAPNILTGLAQLGHQVLNAPSNIANYAASKGAISPNTASMIPRQQDYDFASMMKLPETTSDKFVQGAVKYSPAMLTGEMPLGMLGKGIESIPAAGKFLSGAAGRILPQAGIGAVTNNNPAQGAETSAGIQAALEALTTPFKAIGATAELMNPLKYTNKKIQDIKDTYQASKAAARAQYQPVMKEFGDSPITKAKSYLDSLSDNIGYFSPSVKKMHNNFMDAPTINNAHKLQSQMFSEIKDLSKNKSPDALTYDRINALRDSRENLKSDILNSLRSKDENAANQYLEGARIHRDEISPYFSTPTLGNLVEGQINKMTPERLISTINRAKESNKIPDNHFLRKALQDVGKKVNIGKAAQYVLPMIASTIAGESVSPGWGSAATGIGGGALLGKYGSPAMVELAQNPAIVNALKQAKNYSFPALRGAIGYNVNNP